MMIGHDVAFGAIDNHPRTQAIGLPLARLILRHIEKILEKRVTAEWILLYLNPSSGGDIYDRWQHPFQHGGKTGQRLATRGDR